MKRRKFIQKLENKFPAVAVPSHKNLPQPLQETMLPGIGAEDSFR
jgi:hypothetical protein